MDDPLTKWLHLHSNTSKRGCNGKRTATTRLSPTFFYYKNIYSVVLRRFHRQTRLRVIDVMRGIFSLDFPLLSARTGWLAGEALSAAEFSRTNATRGLSDGGKYA